MVLLAAIAVVPVVSACQFMPASSTTSPTVEPTPAAALPAATVESLPTPAAAATATPEDAPITLTFWTIESISPEAEGPPGDFIGNTLRAFERSQPNVDVNVLLKKPSGKGGMVDFLRTAKPVAPTVLPDVAIINAVDLPQAFADGLIQPLDGRLDRSVVQDLLPAARVMGTVTDRLAGVPLGLEMQHTVYNTTVFTATPVLWSDVFTKNTRYLFPAKGINGLVNDATLSQYFSAGGALLDDQDKPSIDDQALLTVLKLYRQGVENGAIDPAILEASAIDDLWPFYLKGSIGMAQVSVNQYLTDRDQLVRSAFGPPPVLNETRKPAAITRGWVLVLVTNDPGRQNAALNLIEWFLSVNNNAAWNQINLSIPSRGSSFQQLAGNDPYWVFLSEQLNTARPQPGFSGYDRLGRIIQQAVQEVVSGESSPEDAVAAAQDALRQ
jgi:multiple sugar transport system substrate-binding protein